MDLREKIIEAVKAHFGLSDTGATAYKLADPEGIADAILDLPEIKEALEFKRRDDIMCELARGAQQAWRCEKPDGRIG